ncbi:MAG: hypothetical protein JWQ09_5837 [Segetibacter sp.]|nr:hypothetical protein [Segetibacter sp.]
MAVRTKLISKDAVNEILRNDFETLLFHSNGKRLLIKGDSFNASVRYVVDESAKYRRSFMSLSEASTYYNEL